MYSIGQYLFLAGVDVSPLSPQTPRSLLDRTLIVGAIPQMLPVQICLSRMAGMHSLGVGQAGYQLS